MNGEFSHCMFFQQEKLHKDIFTKILVSTAILNVLKKDYKRGFLEFLLSGSFFPSEFWYGDFYVGEF